MPTYEYYCPNCQISFDVRRSMSQANEPTTCPGCHGHDAQRRFSSIACHVKGRSGTSSSASQGSGCAGCSAGSCAGCKR